MDIFKTDNKALALFVGKIEWERLHHGWDLENPFHFPIISFSHVKKSRMLPETSTLVHLCWESQFPGDVPQHLDTSVLQHAWCCFFCVYKSEKNSHS